MVYYRIEDSSNVKTLELYSDYVNKAEGFTDTSQLVNLGKDEKSCGITVIYSTGLSAENILGAINIIPKCNIERLNIRYLKFKEENIGSSQDNERIQRIIELLSIKNLKIVEVLSIINVPDNRLFIEILKLLKDNKNLKFFDFFYKDSSKKNHNDYYHSEETVRSLLQEVFVNNVDLTHLSVYITLSDDDEFNLFKKNSTLQNVYQGIYKPIRNSSVENILKLNKELAIWDTDSTIKLSIFYFLKNISPAPLIGILKSQENHIVPCNPEEPIIQRTLDFYKQDYHCKELIEQLESNHLQGNDRKEVINRLSFVSNTFLNKTLCALSKSHWQQLVIASKFFGLDIVGMLKTAPVDILNQVTNADKKITTGILSQLIDKNYKQLGTAITAWSNPETVSISKDNIIKTRAMQQATIHLQQSILTVLPKGISVLNTIVE